MEIKYQKHNITSYTSFAAKNPTSTNQMVGKLK